MQIKFEADKLFKKFLSSWAFLLKFERIHLNFSNNLYLCSGIVIGKENTSINFFLKLSTFCRFVCNNKKIDVPNIFLSTCKLQVFNKKKKFVYINCCSPTHRCWQSTDFMFYDLQLPGQRKSPHPANKWNLLWKAVKGCQKSLPTLPAKDLWSRYLEALHYKTSTS